MELVFSPCVGKGLSFPHFLSGVESFFKKEIITNLKVPVIKSDLESFQSVRNRLKYRGICFQNMGFLHSIVTSHPLGFSFGP